MNRKAVIGIPSVTGGCKILLQSRITANEFHEAMKYPLYIAQYLGLFPINIGKSFETTKWKWWHWRTAYTFITGTYIVMIVLHNAYEVSTISHDIITTGGLLFSINVLMQFLLFLKLSFHWSQLEKEWHMVEVRIRHYALCGNLKRRLAFITTSVMSVAIVEHVLINIFRFTTCFENNETILEALNIYFEIRTYPTVFVFTKYTLWKGIIMEFIAFQMALIWNYGDVFIVLMGESLRFKLKQISIRVESMITSKVEDALMWRKIRKDYLSVSSLCNQVNRSLSSLIILSFCCNLYLVLLQMFRCMMPIDDHIHKAYIRISFALVVTRLISVIMLGSESNEEWRNIMMSLNCVSSSALNSEVERFIENVVTDELVLSGKQFFSIRRNLILKIAGAIVTYELVLIQFNADLLQ